MTEAEAGESLKLEARIRTEAEKCARAIKLLAGGELRFVPEGMDSSALLACFLLELDKQCASIGAAARIMFSFYPMTPDQLSAQLGAELRAAKSVNDPAPLTAGDAVH